MITIYRTQQEMDKAFLQSSTHIQGCLLISFESYQSLTQPYAARLSIRVENEGTTAEQIEMLTAALAQEETKPVGAAVLLMEYTEGNEMTLTEMDAVHEFLNTVCDENTEMLYSIGANAALKAPHALTLFLFDRR